MTAIKGKAPVRYLVIKAWGQGFWSDTAHVLGGLLLAEVSGRIPVAHWGLASRYRRSSDPAEDAFVEYFEPPSAVTLRDLLEMQSATRFPAKWSAVSLDGVPRRTYVSAADLAARDEDILVSDYYFGVPDVAVPAGSPLHGLGLVDLYRHLAAKYLRPRKTFADVADAFCRRHFDAPFVALHLRGTDKTLEVPTQVLDGYHQATVADLDAEIDARWPVFLMSDDRRLIRQATEALGGRRIVTFDSLRCEGREAPHSIFGDGYRLGSDILTETLIALKADAFHGAADSNVAGMIAMLKPWQGKCSLRGIYPLLIQNAARSDLA